MYGCPSTKSSDFFDKKRQSHLLRLDKVPAGDFVECKGTQLCHPHRFAEDKVPAVQSKNASFLAKKQTYFLFMSYFFYIK
jgi:hypothetical protein